jgi:hypothetical protein
MGERLQQTIEVVEKLENLLHEGRALLKDLRKEIKTAENIKQELQAAALVAINDRVEDILEQLLEEKMAHVVKEVGLAQDEAVKKVIDSFDEISNVLMYGNAQGRGENLFDRLALQAARKRALGEK